MMAAGTKWIQFEFCTIQSVFNTDDTPCTCTLTSFLFEHNYPDALPSADIRMMNIQMCDMICDNSNAALVPLQLITTNYHTISYNTASGFLAFPLKPPELV